MLRNHTSQLLIVTFNNYSPGMSFYGNVFNICLFCRQSLTCKPCGEDKPIIKKEFIYFYRIELLHKN